jgi:hypothetical protein
MTGRKLQLVLLLVAFAACSGDWPIASGSVLAGLTPEQVDSLKNQEQQALVHVQVEQSHEAAALDSATAAWDTLRLTYVAGAPGLLNCRPGEYHSAVRIVGADGADLRFGENRLRIPKGALDEPVVITAEELVGTQVQVRLSPHGLTFKKQPRLTIDYRRCEISPDLQEKVAYVDDSLHILEWPSAREDNSGPSGRISTWIDHFSRYAIAY